MTVPPLSTCIVKYRITYWVKVDEEPNRQQYRRFTRKTKVTVHNELPFGDVWIAPNENDDNPAKIAAGQSVMVVNLDDTNPADHDGDFAYDFRFVSVAEADG